jgi:AcrR family transcriptional regulator
MSKSSHRQPRRAKIHEKPRKTPTQERGQRKVDQLLDATAEVFADVGYEAATTNAIAARAGVPIGSLYQFFRNKDALLLALGQRYADQMREVQEGMLGSAPELPLPELYHRIIHTMADFHERHPGFRPLFFGSATQGLLADVAASISAGCVDRVDKVLAVRMPWLNAQRRRLYATVNVEVVKNLLPLAASGDAKWRESVLEEIKTLLLAHMEHVRREHGQPES